MMQKVSDYKDLTSISYSIRKSIVKSITVAGSGYMGRSLALADIFTSLYFNRMNHNPGNPGWEDRDRLILSDSHLASVLYATLAHAGYFDLKELYTMRNQESRLPGNPAFNKNLLGVETTSASTLQGFSNAVGMALAAKMDKKMFRIYSVSGDVEMQEDEIREAAMAAAHHKLDNLTAIVDCNGLQIDGKTTGVFNTETQYLKWLALGWNVVECNGHNFSELLSSLDKVTGIKEKPGLILANTIPGKGIKTIENDQLWHGKAPNHDEATEFLCQLDESLLMALEELVKSAF
jgi:transketolase